jgi:hypothetical protein
MHLVRACLAAATVAGSCAALAAPADTVRITLVLKNHRFDPSAISVPAGRRVLIDLTNLDSASDEFDSSDLKVEEDITPKGHISFTVGPLKPGLYRFMGEAHPSTALGRITVTTAGA